MLILITAFTIGHSITLLLSVLDIFRISGKWVEFLIPCTIVITALTNLLQKNPKAGSVHINYILALFFGLIHGMGFANTIRFMLAADQGIGWGLFGFNAGLEVGQIVMVLFILGISFVFVSLLKVGHRNWVLFLSAAVFSLALKMSIERLPF